MKKESFKPGKRYTRSGTEPEGNVIMIRKVGGQGFWCSSNEGQGGVGHEQQGGRFGDILSQGRRQIHQEQRADVEDERYF